MKKFSWIWLFLGISCFYLDAHFAQEEEKMIGIIFDCDGTLIDSEHAHFLSWQEALKKRGVILDVNEFFSLSGNSGEYIAEKLLNQYRLDSVEAILEDKREAYHKIHEQGISR